MRLQKFLAHAGVTSRRKAEELIAAGRVRVNRRIVRTLGTGVAAGDRVEVDGKQVEIPADFTYAVLHKPQKVMTTLRDPEGRRTVAEMIPKALGRLVPVGRLDYDTSGVLLLTDDGDLAHVLTHPRFGVEKTYRALVRGRLEAADMRAFLAGIRLEEGKTQPAKVRVVRSGAQYSEVDITIHEGRNRQVRRMFEATEHPVVALSRLKFGPISLGELPPGHVREATDREVSALRNIARNTQDDD
ncbi:MAG: rRNA pseudouridine synthase [Candidatus Eremiobacteraeota bacterium]|nr:rRNA pseudouridine synthase [Candidatus Eremiobacteraeota bacterium]